MGHRSTGMQILQKLLGWSMLGNLLTALILPKLLPQTLWEEIRSLHYEQESGWEVSVDSPPTGKGKYIGRIVFTQGPGCTWQVTRKDGETQCVPQGDSALGEKQTV